MRAYWCFLDELRMEVYGKPNERPQWLPQTSIELAIKCCDPTRSCI